jgi:hypothetical protein
VLTRLERADWCSVWRDPPSWWCSAYFADAGNAGNLSMSRAIVLNDDGRFETFSDGVTQ